MATNSLAAASYPLAFSCATWLWSLLARMSEALNDVSSKAAGTAQDPFLNVAAKPAKELTQSERQFALQYLFQANPTNVIGRYPRYRELRERFWEGKERRVQG